MKVEFTMQKEVIVIGAGMVGTSVAWHLQKNGTKVLMLDKRAPGSETSYGNAGLIQREAVHVHGFPRKLEDIVRVLPNTAPDIRYRLTGIIKYWDPLFKYWLNSSDEKIASIDKEWATLIQHSTSEHEYMINASEAQDLVRKVGWIAMYRSESKLNDAVKTARELKDKGIEYKVLTRDELSLLEPNVDLKGFVGAIHWKNSWQVVDPGALVKAYAKNFETMGGGFQQCIVQSLSKAGDIWQVNTDCGLFEAKKVVVAAGPWSTELTEPLGYSIPLFPMRGYHQHFRIEEKDKINHSLVDMDNGFVMGPMRQGIRVTTGAEMTPIDAPKRFEQINQIIQRARQLVNLGDAVEEEAWCGSRPCLPDMKPIIGPASKHEDLWMAFGHGHQGFTLGPITGRLIEQMINNKTLTVNPQPFKCSRFT